MITPFSQSEIVPNRTDVSSHDKVVLFVLIFGWVFSIWPLLFAIPTFSINTRHDFPEPSVPSSIYRAESSSFPSSCICFLLVVGILTAILGVSVMFSTFDSVMIFAGISLIFDGVKRLIVTICYGVKVKQAKKVLQEQMRDHSRDIYM